ncbi:MAG: MATE family efflux transporter [Rhizobiaceae bacterium]|nr:MATE family efflux transporter [Rhizobiaceae bacterium]
MRHVIVMTLTGSIGLVAIFVVDALNLFYISRLGIAELAAAVGFASTLLFFTVSVAIGLTIASGALVARALGQGSREAAARVGGASLIFVALITAAMSAISWPFLRPLLALLGANGETLDLATRFLSMILPSTPIFALGMCTSGILRGVGDARRAMYVTLGGGIATAILDPLLIFGAGLGLDGAAIANVISRFVLLAIGLHGAVVVHGLVKLPDFSGLRTIARPFMAIGVPAMLTQVATPVGNAYVTRAIAQFGDEAMAGWAIVGRIVPVAFGVIFALSGAVGPILGQNYGAGKYERLRTTMRDALIFTTVYVSIVWLALVIAAGPIADLFGAVGVARDVVMFFCLIAAGSFLFNGGIFVASAAFNNLGFPIYSTVFNWGRSTLGIVPFVAVGSHFYGLHGVLMGWALGAVVFGIAAVVVCFRVIGQVGKEPPPPRVGVPDPPASAQSPLSSGEAATAG